MARSSEAVGQHAKQRLLTWRNDWFLDTEAGVQYIPYVFPRPANPDLAEALIKQTIARTPGVTEITSFEVEYDRRQRGMNVIQSDVLTRFDDIATLQVGVGSR